ncbi:MAG TPA: class I SAM-dependent methyltransferase [Alphaproteobacteria bacterium]|nr:class I SAM-dependent methyltransferase [Alphaproteobacteria bacterium]
MSPGPSEPQTPHALYTDAEWYDRSINWPARLGRELPVLTEVFGPPGSGGILDAGCGVGRQAAALAQRGYRVTAADASEEMLAQARERARADGIEARFIHTPYQRLSENTGGGFDGIYCIGNSLAAAGSQDAVRQAVAQFGMCLCSGGRLFIQILNFKPMHLETPCIRGPRVSHMAGREYVSVRLFHFDADGALVTNITLWNDNGWHQRAHSGRLYPAGLDELTAWCKEGGLTIDHTWGSYNREQFDEGNSVDLILVATRG